MRAKVVQLKEIITYTQQSPAARQGTARQAFALETCCVAATAAAEAMAAAAAATAAAAQLAGGLTTADTVRSSINRSSGAQKCSASAR